MIKESSTRTRRLRKKLRVGEFQVMGFSLAISLRDSLSDEQTDAFWDRFIQEAIEGQSLTYGGLTEGYVIPDGNISATESDRGHVKQWLMSQPEIADLRVDELSDSFSQRGLLFPLRPIRHTSSTMTKKHWVKYRRTEF